MLLIMILVFVKVIRFIHTAYRFMILSFPLGVGRLCDPTKTDNDKMITQQHERHVKILWKNCYVNTLLCCCSCLYHFMYSHCLINVFFSPPGLLPVLICSQKLIKEKQSISKPQYNWLKSVSILLFLCCSNKNTNSISAVPHINKM